MKTRQLYIAYGSNLNLPQMSRRCPTASIVGTSEVKDYELLFRGNENSAVATIEPLMGNSVPVLVWDVQERDELSLDRYEGFPNFYRKELLDIELNGEMVSAMVYVMNDGYGFGAPSDYYLNTIAEGYASAGFDTEVLDQAVEKSIELAKEQEELNPRQGSIFGQKWW